MGSSKEWMYVTANTKSAQSCSKCSPRGPSWNIARAQSYGIYIVSQGFLKGDIHPAPDIPSCDHGCFVMFTMPKDAHDDAAVVQKLRHRDSFAGIQSAVSCASLSWRVWLCFQQNSSNPLHSPNPGQLLLSSKLF